MIVEAVFELARARWLVKNKSFNQWHERMGQPAAIEDTSNTPKASTQDLEKQADQLGRIVRKVARNAPFKANCLPQAAAAQSMLKRRGIRDGIVFLGGRKGTQSDPLDLHAWLFVGTVCVTGNDGPGDLESFKPLVRYELSEPEA